MTDTSDKDPAADHSPSPPSACANCGSPLNGHFCAICGQPNREIRRPVYSLLRELFHVVLDLDGRAYRTVGLLLTRPAFLSNAYVSGQRMRYTPPLRLFIAVSILFFVVVTAGNSLGSLRDAMLDIQNVDTTAQDSNAAAQSSNIQAQLDGADLEGVYTLIENIRLPLLSDTSNANLQAVMRNQAEENFRSLVEDPRDTLMGLMEYITVFLLVMMPLLALIQNLFFVTSGRYYIEHLVLVLHNNAFVIAILLLQTLLDAVVSAEVTFISGLASLFSDLAAIWMPVYLFLSLKFFFHRGWLLSVLLFLLISIAYAIITLTGMIMLAMTLFLLF
jgi:hypothetical protein